MGLMSINIAPAEPIDDPVAYAVAAARDAAESAALASVEYWAREVAAHALMDDLAARLGVDHGLVWQVLCNVPDNMLTLLDSPQGWTALAGYVSAELGIVAPDYMPTMH